MLVKEIRLVGQLRALASAWPAGDASAAALSVVHLVRDPRSMLASQKKLGWWRLREGTPAARLKNLEYIANRTCVGMLADADAGAELAKQRGAAAYVRVRFEDLLADIKGAAAALSRQLGLPVAPAAAEWLERFTQGDCDSHTPRPGMTPEQAYQYGTCRDPTAAQRAVAGKSWKHALNAAREAHNPRALRRRAPPLRLLGGPGQGQGEEALRRRRVGQVVGEPCRADLRFSYRTLSQPA